MSLSTKVLSPVGSARIYAYRCAFPAVDRIPFMAPQCFLAQATAAYEGARDKIARLINARSSREIVFTSNGTAALNLVAHSWGRSNLGPVDEVSTIAMPVSACNLTHGHINDTLEDGHPVSLLCRGFMRSAWCC